MPLKYLLDLTFFRVVGYIDFNYLFGLYFDFLFQVKDGLTLIVSRDELDYEGARKYVAKV